MTNQNGSDRVRIDAHHHLWRYTPEEYGWIDGSMSVLRHDYLPEQLLPVLDLAGVEGAVAVQARQSLEETDWLLHLAEETPRIHGVVGWASIADREFPEMLDRLRQQRKLKGLRHVIQDEPDDNFILGADFNSGIRALRDTGIVYDILVHARHLPQTIRFVDMHPDQPFVLDHCAKPNIAGGELEPWSRHIRDLAKRPNVYCKLSGLTTEAVWDRWMTAELAPYWRVVVEAFEPRRLLFGSDWPVVLLAGGYQRWADTVAEWLRPLTRGEQQDIWGGTARRAYRLPDTGPS